MTLFDPLTVGDLHLRNRVMRSATAEFVADKETGAPTPEMAHIYRELAEGEVGLIVTGHTCVSFAGRAHAGMAAMASDDLISPWRDVIRPAQKAGGRVMMQINHAGANVDPEVTPHPLSPSGVATNDLVKPRTMSEGEIGKVVAQFGEAARRVREAGFDGVQIHGAHGYLITQFLTPETNFRQDRWGGDEERRSAFLKAVVAEMRRQVGPHYPVWIKLGVAGRESSGLDVEKGARIAAWCASYGIDCVEISFALGRPEWMDLTVEAPLRPLAGAVRDAVGPDYPLALVYGFRTRRCMERVLSNGAVQLISLCRPLIAEPDLVRKIKQGLIDEVACVRCDLCHPGEGEEGIACRNERVLEDLS
ncbi:MAG: hypothetical protein ACLFV5_00995 [Anaerolineales bacterium]